MHGSRTRSSLAILASLVLAGGVTACGEDSGGNGSEGDPSDAVVPQTPDYDEFVQQVEDGESDATRFSVSPDEKSITVEESTGIGYTLDVPEGEIDSLVSTLEDNGIEVDVPKR